MNNNFVEPNGGISKTKEICVGSDSLGKGKTNEQVKTNTNSVKSEGLNCKTKENWVEPDARNAKIYAKCASAKTNANCAKSGEAQTNGNCVESHPTGELMTR